MAKVDYNEYYKHLEEKAAEERERKSEEAKANFDKAREKELQEQQEWDDLLKKTGEKVTSDNLKERTRKANKAKAKANAEIEAKAGLKTEAQQKLDSAYKNMADDMI